MVSLSFEVELKVSYMPVVLLKFSALNIRVLIAPPVLSVELIV